MADVHWREATTEELRGVRVLFSSWGLWIQSQDDFTWELHPWDRIGKVTGLDSPVTEASGQPFIEDPAGLTTKLGEAERTLEAITDVAAGEVGVAVTAEQKLADAELRLNRIYEIAKGEDE